MRRVAWASLVVLAALGWWREYFLWVFFGGPALLFVLFLGFSGRPAMALRSFGTGLLLGAFWAYVYATGLIPGGEGWLFFALSGAWYAFVVWAQAESARMALARPTPRRVAVRGAVFGHLAWWLWVGALSLLAPQGRWDDLIFLAVVVLFIAPGAALGAIGATWGALPRR
jgi:hypothetical protein